MLLKVCFEFKRELKREIKRELKRELKREIDQARGRERAPEREIKIEVKRELKSDLNKALKGNSLRESELCPVGACSFKGFHDSTLSHVQGWCCKTSK